jgi:hypothetical protein
MRYRTKGRDFDTLQTPAPAISDDTRENIHKAAWWAVEGFCKEHGDRPTSIQLFMWSDMAKARALAWRMKAPWESLEFTELEVAHYYERLGQASIQRNNCGRPCVRRVGPEELQARCTLPTGHDGEHGDEEL